MFADPFFYITCMLGLGLGSFATALSYRMPRDISMIAKTRSACPTCDHQLSAGDLVPLFSWLLFRGRCRYCKAPIGWRYPLIEVATVLLCVAIYARFGFSPQSLCLMALAPVIVSIADIDLHYKIIPDELNLAVFFCGIAAIVAGGWDSSSLSGFIGNHGGTALLACAIWGGGSYLLRQVFALVLKKEPMGLGDVKFFAAAGVFLGLSPDAAALFMILAGGSGIVLALLWKKVTGEAEFPFGPSLLAAFVPVLFVYPPEFVIF